MQLNFMFGNVTLDLLYNLINPQHKSLKYAKIKEKITSKMIFLTYLNWLFFRRILRFNC